MLRPSQGSSRRPNVQEGPLSTTYRKRRITNTTGEFLVEHTLVERARAGDSFAIGKLVEMYQSRIRRLLLGIVGPSDDIDDLTQEVFLQAFKSVRRFRGDSSFYTWLHRISTNIALTFLRRKKRMPVMSNENSLPATEANQNDTVRIMDEIKELHRVLDTVSPKRRIAFVLFEIEEYSLAEIAEMTGTNVATIKSRLFFGRKEIMKKAKENPVLKEMMRETECASS